MENVRGVTVVRYAGEGAGLIVNGIIDQRVKLLEERNRKLQRALLEQNELLMEQCLENQREGKREALAFLSKRRRAQKRKHAKGRTVRTILGMIAGALIGDDSDV